MLSLVAALSSSNSKSETLIGCLAANGPVGFDSSGSSPIATLGPAASNDGYGYGPS